jgi:hypothetical protein
VTGVACWADVALVLPGVTCAAAGGGFVYLATGRNGHVKVGFSRSPARRVMVMNGAATRSAFERTHGFDPGHAEVRVLVGRCSVAHERALHTALASEAVGGEWFCGPMSSALVSHLARVALPPSAAHVRSVGQKLLREACAARGAAERMAAALGVSPATVSIWRNGGASPAPRSPGARIHARRSGAAVWGHRAHGSRLGAWRT